MAITNSAGDVGRRFGINPSEDIPGGGGPAPPANNLLLETGDDFNLESPANLDLES